MMNQYDMKSSLQSCKHIFQTKDEKQMKALRDTIYKLVLDAEETGSVENLKNSFTQLTDEYERIYASLEIEEKERVEWRYFREIYTMVNYVFDRCEYFAKKNLLQNIRKRYPKAVPVLSVVKEHHTISGKDLQNAVGMKNRSALTNFLNRIEPYNLVSVRKFGTNSYISLTANGRNLLDLVDSDEGKSVSSKKIEFDALIKLLNALEQALSEEKPNTYTLIHDYLTDDFDIGQKGIIKHKVDSILSQKEKLVRDQILRAEEKAAQMIERNEYRGDAFLFRDSELKQLDNAFMSDYYNPFFSLRQEECYA